MAIRPSGSRFTLQEAIALLIHNQAEYVGQLAEMNKRHNKLELEARRQFARIEREMDEIKAVLREMHQTILQLPEAVRKKIGFKTK